MPASDVVTLDVSNVSKAYAVLGGFIVIYGLMSYVAKDRLYLSEPLIAVTVGILTGPYVLGWVDPLSWGDSDTTSEVTYEIARLVVGIQVLFTGISLPKAYLRHEAMSLLVLLLGVMTIAWFVSALLIWGLIPNLTYLESLCISAAITPTDPVLANSITKGRFAEKHVPHNLRNIILAESGANDGLGFPFLFMALYLIQRTGVDRGTSIGTEVGRWVYGVLIYRILLSCVYGAIVGVLAHKTLKWAETRGYIDRDNFFAYGLGLALFTLGTTGLFNSDDILSCFVAGNAFTWKDWYRVRTQVEEEDSFQDILDSLLNTAIFIYIGAIIPWADYNTANSSLQIAPWRIVLLGITVLLLRRPPWVIALMKVIPAITNRSEAYFAGWFGPIGVGALYYIEVALREIPDDGTRDRLRAVYSPIVLFCIFSSVLTHGITIPIAKHGPNIVRKTTSFSAHRSISFTTRPTTTSQPGSDKHEKPIWNPFWSLMLGLKSIVLFWRKDSFWRKETEYQKKRRVLHGDNISQPVKATKMAEMDSQPSDAENDGVVASVSGSVEDSGSVTRHGGVPVEEQEKAKEKVADLSPPSLPQAVAAPKDKMHPPGFLHSVEDRLRAEWRAERVEAEDEAAGRVHHHTFDPSQQDRAEPSSMPGTPGGTRIRWQDRSSHNVVKD